MAEVLPQKAEHPSDKAPLSLSALQSRSNKEAKLQDQSKLVQVDDQKKKKKTLTYNKVINDVEVCFFIFVDANCNLLFRKKTKWSLATSVHV